jgi:hypothetical protein
MRVLGLTIFFARLCGLIAGLSLLALIVVTAAHFAPVVIYTGDDGSGNAYQPGWGMVAALAGSVVVFSLVRFALVALAAYVLVPDEDPDDYNYFY